MANYKINENKFLYPEILSKKINYTENRRNIISCCIDKQFRKFESKQNIPIFALSALHAWNDIGPRKCIVVLKGIQIKIMLLQHFFIGLKVVEKMRFYINWKLANNLWIYQECTVLLIIRFMFTYDMISLFQDIQKTWFLDQNMRRPFLIKELHSNAPSRVRMPQRLRYGGSFKTKMFLTWA